MYCILFSNVKKYVPGKTKEINTITEEIDHRSGDRPHTAENRSSALVIMLLVIGAIQMSKSDKIVIKLCKLFWKRVSSLLSPTVSNMLCVFLTTPALSRPLPWK